MDCDIDNNTLLCRVCGARVSAPHVRRNCGPTPKLDDMVVSGLPAIGITKNQSLCGTELKALLRDWLGIEATPTCSCNAMARQMDSLGPDWCEGEGMTQILDVMRAEHGKRWADGRTILPWTDVGAKQLVLLACRRSRAKSAG